MSTNHDAVAAFPSAGNSDKVLARNLVTKRMPYVLADTDDVTNLVAVDPVTGAAIIDILFLGRVFHYDATDVVTANDGVSCLVSFEGRRYKLSSSTDVFAFAVLDNTHAAPPGSPVIGDSYLIAAAATGAWVGKSNYVTVFTRRGWEFINFGIGRFIYVEAIDTYYHKNAGGAWVTGIGAQTLAANSVPLSAAINFGKRLIVENQTTTAPPGSPTVGTAYIIGPSATGAWAGLDGRIAICEAAGAFVIYTPTNGWAAYDKARSIEFRYSGSAWLSAAGAFIGTASASYAANADISTPTIPFDDTIPQISEGTQIISTSYTMKSTTNKLRLRLTGTFSHNTVSSAAIAFFQDAIANALKAAPFFFPAANNVYPFVLEHEYVPGTTSPITISVRAAPTGSGLIRFNGLPTARVFGGANSVLLTLEEIPA